jgi:TM2 domain-containing membrane protein YozV
MEQLDTQQAGGQITKRRVAAALAFAGALNPLPLPLAGIHKFYLGHPGWGVLYLLLNWTQIPRIACVLEGVWYLLPWPEPRKAMISPTAAPDLGTTQQLAQQTQLVTATIRDLEQLRQEGLITEWEFEQQRRQLLAPAEN